MDKLYPPPPQIADYSFLNPSQNFVRTAKNVLFAIILFFFTYLVLIAFSVGLLFVCVMVGIGIMGARFNGLTIALGGGIICLGLMFMGFLLKFIFSIKENKNTERVEITRNEHPRLFEFINRLVVEVKSPYPKKVFVVPNVNAAVFYNSSFWSMFFPVRKNLEIGLGLVNSVNISEFKAVLAHEFGHFSQRSMKIGSYVYTVNRAIYSMVYEYDSWDELLDKWVASGGVFGIFASITRFMVNGVRGLLRKAYELINIRYMGLSREMEYNADLIAVSAAGNAAAISALRRIGFGDEAYNRAIDQLNFLISQQKKTDNIYEKQLAMIDYMAGEKNLGLKQNLPVLTDYYMQITAPKNRVYFKDQWSTHPEQKDREININSVGLVADINEESPWLLFDNPEKLQKELTAGLYENIPEETGNKTEIISRASFISSINERKEQYKYPEVFKHFYDGRYLFDVDIEKLDNQPELGKEAIFNDDTRKLIDGYYSNLEDSRLLESIANGSIQTKTFDFDGDKYDQEDAEKVRRELDNEIAEQKERITYLETNALQIGYWRAKEAGVDKEFNAKLELYRLLLQKADVMAGFRDRIEWILQYIRENLPLDQYHTKMVEGYLDELYTSINTELNSVEGWGVEMKMLNTETTASFREYLLQQPLQRAGSNFFTGENFDTLYQQIYHLENKINHACVLALKEFISFKGELYLSEAGI